MQLNNFLYISQRGGAYRVAESTSDPGELTYSESRHKVASDT